MTTLDRTAYPYFKRSLSRLELERLYKPTPEEIALTQEKANGGKPRLIFLTLLKSFQYLGYFPGLTTIPKQIWSYVEGRVPWVIEPEDKDSTLSEPTLYRYHTAIREHLKIQVYPDGGAAVARAAIEQATLSMDQPADLINAAIEELVRQRYELPAFSTLNRITGHLRSQAHGLWFNQVASLLSEAEMEKLKQLLTVRPGELQSDFVTLKEVPSAPNLTEFDQVEKRLHWLEGLLDVERLLASIPLTKIRHFAAEARRAEKGDFDEKAPAKECTLLLCLIYQAQMRTRDHLAEIFGKRIAVMHKNGKDELADAREKMRNMTEQMVDNFKSIVESAAKHTENAILGQEVRDILDSQGGVETLLEDCERILAYRDNNYLPLVHRFYSSHRPVLLHMSHILKIRSISEDRAVLDALAFVQANFESKEEWLPAGDLNLDFTSRKWQNLVSKEEDGQIFINRRHFEVCVFSALASELHSGDCFIVGAESYADYREQLLPWEECVPRIKEYCQQIGIPASPKAFVRHLQHLLSRAARAVDRSYPGNEHWYFNKKGKPVLRRGKGRKLTAEAKRLKRELLRRMPQRSLLDILSNVQHWVNFARHFGPASGAEPHRSKTKLRYVLTTFCYGCNLGPHQTTRHLKIATRISPRIIAYINQEHISAELLNDAINDIINHYTRFELPYFWGSGKTVAADGTEIDLSRNNLMAERHVRYGRYGGIAYHHVSDMYVALFSHFIACGVWEAVYIIDGLLKNKSDIQPDTIHADSQGQAEPVFGLSFMLGINLMPRIRSWADLKMYRPFANSHYKHIDALFSDVIHWDVIERHWKELMQVVISIHAGKVLPSMLLRKLGSYSRKNSLYHAFQELGRVIRTIFLLNYVSNLPLRQYITATTNKVESYNGFLKWLFFGGLGVISHDDPIEYEKRVKYTDLIANAIMLQNVVDMTRILRQLAREGYVVTRETLSFLSPYLNEHIRRFGDYVIDLDKVPLPLELDEPLLDLSPRRFFLKVIAFYTYSVRKRLPADET